MGYVHRFVLSSMNSEPDSGGGCAVILIIVVVGISILAIGIGFMLAFFTVDSSDNSSMVNEPVVAERAVSAPPSQPAVNPAANEGNLTASSAILTRTETVHDLPVTGSHRMESERWRIPPINQRFPQRTGLTFL
jgi:hypothetical protein